MTIGHTNQGSSDLIAAFLAQGGKVEKVPADAQRTYNNREWRALVRAETYEVEDANQGFRATKGFVSLNGGLVR